MSKYRYGGKVCEVRRRGEGEAQVTNEPQQATKKQQRRRQYHTSRKKATPTVATTTPTPTQHKQQQQQQHTQHQQQILTNSYTIMVTTIRSPQPQRKRTRKITTTITTPSLHRSSVRLNYSILVTCMLCALYMIYLTFGPLKSLQISSFDLPLTNSTKTNNNDNFCGYNKQQQKTELFKNDTLSCEPGTFKNIDQWRGLFPRLGFPLKGKALVSIPIGIKGRESVDALIESMGHDAFDYFLFAFDDTNWETSKWYGKSGVSVERVSGHKWTLYYDYLNASLVEPYTHIFLWDDDLQPAPGFDGKAILHILQSLYIEIAAPMIRNGDHGYPGTATRHRENTLEPLHTVEVVEIMAPIYSKRVWLQCLLPYLVRDRGTGWGIDAYLQNYGGCVPGDIYTMRFPLDHIDTKTLSKNGGRGSLGKYTQEVLARGVEPRAGFNGPKFNYGIKVDSNCDMVKLGEQQQQEGNK